MDMRNELGLISEDGKVKAALTAVQLNARVDGLLMTLKMRQHYVNESTETIEAVYTFPAGWGSNLLGFNVEIDGERLSAVALPKKTAEKKYEKAIESGDTPVMLEVTDQGLYTANLGNLKPDEKAIIEIEYAQMLRCVKGNVRITIPTVIGNRYGDQQTQGKLLGHQQVSTDALVEYPLQVKLEVVGELSKGEISCASHVISISNHEKVKTIEIKEGAYLDRDFILNIDQVKNDSFVIAAPDGKEYAVIASFCPSLPKAESTPILMKILVDCSGSMQGESIRQVRDALDALTLEINERDFVSFSKFGSDVVHVTEKMEQATEKFIKKTLAKAIYKTEANLGGTQIKNALRSTYELTIPSDYKQSVNVLLITDGDVWETEAAIKDAKKYNHRIFAIGVGSAPAESLLRELALGTGGACELVTPNESIEAATMRMFERMRSVQTNKLALNWSGQIEWRSFLPNQIFSDETVNIYANVKSLPTEMPILEYEIDGVKHSCQAESIDLQSDNKLSRVCAAAHIADTKNEKIATNLALKYQLPSKYTNLILVHERAEEDKAVGLPSLKQIKQMQAAGWGGFGKTVTYSNHMVLACKSVPSDLNYTDLAVPSVWRTNRAQAAAKVDQLSSGGMDGYEIPAFLRRTDGDGFIEKKDSAKPEIEIDKGFPPKAIIDYFNKASLMNNDLRDVIESINRMLKDSTVWHFIKDAEKIVKQDQIELYWCVIINLLSEKLGGKCNLERHAQRLLNTVLNLLDPKVREKIESDFLQKFTLIKESNWGTDTDGLNSIGNKLKSFLNI